MKRITVMKVKKDLIDLKADESTTELILNNVSLYNDLVKLYKDGVDTNNYLLYQLNNQIIKQIESIKNINMKQEALDKKYNIPEEDDPFLEMKKKMKTNDKPGSKYQIR